MATMLLAGIDRLLIGRAKELIGHLPVRAKAGWDFKFLQSGKVPGLVPGHVSDVLRMAANTGGAHVVGIRPPAHVGRQAEVVSKAIRQSFRFRWLDDIGRVLSQQDQFDNVMIRVLEEEDWWRSNVLPTSCHDPQILPKTFSLDSRLSEFWRLVEAYNDLGGMKRVVPLMALFPQLHRIPKGGAKAWRDDAGLSWDDYGAHHGSPPFPQDWKYSYYLPERFHFDVEHSRGSAFSYTCANGYVHGRKKKEHVNVNSHGFVLGVGPA